MRRPARVKLIYINIAWHAYSAEIRKSRHGTGASPAQIRRLWLKVALLRELDCIIDGDSHFLSPRIQTVKAIRAKIRPEPMREPLPPLKCTHRLGLIGAPAPVPRVRHAVYRTGLVFLSQFQRKRREG
jgi:hypothetical protein